MAASSTSDAASAHAAVGSLVHKTQELAGVLLQLRQQPDASDELASRARALNAECEQHWAVVASAAASIDAAGASQAQGSSSGDEASEVAALEHQRRELQEAVGAQNDVLKQQIDMLRRLLCDIQLMGGSEDAHAEAPG